MFSAGRDLAIYDPVQFRDGGTVVVGHLARKSPKIAWIVSSDGRTCRVDWQSVKPDPRGSRERVRFREDVFKDRFRPDDEVMFRANHSEVLYGVITRMSRRRALVVSDDENKAFHVPYESLALRDPSKRRDDWNCLSRIERKAEQLMAQHGLERWSFQFDDALSRAGVCFEGLRVISLSRQFCVHASYKEIEDLILHEIAHALAGHRHHHDAVWKKVARSIGCTAERCHDVNFAPPKFIVSCPRCPWKRTANRRKSKAVCRTCGTRVRYQFYTKKRWQAA